jgi:predicted  nucleic acid-binding Zn-ribbon protein
MPYHKNKQQAFQAAQQGTHQAKDIYENTFEQSADYGHHLKRLTNEINEAYEQIENALEVATPHQIDQLQQFKNDLDTIKREIGQNE